MGLIIYFLIKITKDLLEMGIPSYRIDASGHAKPHDLIRFINEINPEELIPIYINHTELFERIFKKEKLKII
jgi:mRNA degradation ribonuclease J1/J2